MVVDLSPIVQTLLGLASAVLTAAAPIVVLWMAKRLRLDQNAALTALVTDAAGRGAGVAYEFLAGSAKSVTDVTIRNAAIGQGVQYVAAMVPDSLKSLGLTNTHVAQLVTAELGRLLAVDPSVKLP